MLPNNYNIINNYFSKQNYIPVKNYADFEYDVYSYYNQYYASEKTTQNRRIMRNYLNNQESIKKSNQNPFMNKQGKKFYFYNANNQMFMIIQEGCNIRTFININKNWCQIKNMSLSSL
jgi:hypothetical protein